MAKLWLAFTSSWYLEGSVKLIHPLSKALKVLQSYFLIGSYWIFSCEVFIQRHGLRDRQDKKPCWTHPCQLMNAVNCLKRKRHNCGATRWITGKQKTTNNSAKEKGGWGGCGFDFLKMQWSQRRGGIFPNPQHKVQCGAPSWTATYRSCDWKLSLLVLFSHSDRLCLNSKKFKFDKKLHWWCPAGLVPES